MKLSIPRDNLFDALHWPAAPSPPAAPCPRSAASTSRSPTARVTLRATDMELGIRPTLDDAKVEQRGRRPASRPAPGRRRPQPSRRRGRPSSCAAEQRDVEITAGRARFHLRTLPADDFPRLPEAEGEAVEAAGRRRWPRRSSRSPAPPRATRRARSSPASWSRPRAIELTMVATDSYRLASSTPSSRAPRRRAARGERPGPRPARARARDRQAEGAEEVEVAMTRNQAIFRAGARALARG